MADESVILKGLCERITFTGGQLTQKTFDGRECVITQDMPSHKEAMELVLKAMLDAEKGALKSVDEISAVGHRVLHGGEKFSGSVLVTEAVKDAIYSPLLETTIDGAKKVVLNVAGSSDLGLMEIEQASELVHQLVDPDANIIFGAAVDPNMKDEISITVIATGFDAAGKKDSAADKSEEQTESVEEDLDDIDAFIRKLNSGN